jgi:hypothetical protein
MHVQQRPDALPDDGVIIDSDESILVLEEWGNRLETVEDATGDGVF